MEPVEGLSGSSSKAGLVAPQPGRGLGVRGRGHVALLTHGAGAARARRSPNVLRGVKGQSPTLVSFTADRLRLPPHFNPITAAPAETAA